MNDITRASTTAALLQALPPLLGAISAASRLAVSKPSTITRYLDLAQGLIAAGSAAYRDLVSLTQSIQVMVRQNRNPTDEEWSAMEQRSDLAHASIQSYDIDAEGEVALPVADEPSEDATTAKSGA